MRLRRHSRQDEPEIDLTPMLDIVFIMLIFFIVSTSFVKPSGIEVNPPVAASSRDQEEVTVEIGMDADGRIFLTGQEVGSRQLVSRVQQLQQRQTNTAILLRADANVRHGMVVEVLDQLRQGGIEQVALATEPTP